MKKIFVQFLFVTAFIPSFFAQDLGKLVIRNGNSNYPKFIASLNGVRLSNDYSSSVSFSLLDEYNYRLKILQAGSSNILTFTLTSEPKYQSKYIIMKDNFGNYSLLLETKSLMLDEPEIPAVTNTVVTTQTVNVVTPTLATNTATVAPIVTPANTVAITNISKVEFDERLNAVKKTSFDDKRLAKAKQVFNDEILSTNQVIEVVKAFSFDDTKLDFAKWAYKNTIDPKNYYKVEDQFSFSGTKSALGDFVRKQPK
ncbi:MAG: DUF4476 domain-containing protein [Bacteroidota bacterium]|nr:DUF4476 domain-containing protein [Bacteroidota bacterium]